MRTAYFMVHPFCKINTQNGTWSRVWPKHWDTKGWYHILLFYSFRSDLLKSWFNIGQHLMIQLLVISTRELHHTKIAATSCHWLYVHGPAGFSIHLLSLLKCVNMCLVTNAFFLFLKSCCNTSKTGLIFRVTKYKDWKY